MHWKKNRIIVPKIKSDNNALLSVQKKGQGVRMYRSKSVEILAKNKTITYCECVQKITDENLKNVCSS